MENYILYAYLVSAVLFMIGLKRLGSPATARKGNWLSMLAMAIAIGATALNTGMDFKWILIGAVIGAIIGIVAAKKVEMTSMPEMIALFNGCGGAASALVAIAEFYKLNPNYENFLLTTILLSVVIGGLTVTGSILAFVKLKELITGQPIVYKGQQFVNSILGVVMIAAAVGLFYRPESFLYFYIMLGLAMLLGILLVLPIGGADMPVVVSLLNSYSGVAVSMTGFVLNNNSLIIVGAMVGAAGLILTKIMCDAMNRSLANVLFGAFGAVDDTVASGDSGESQGTVKAYTVDDMVILLQNADSVIFVPGYGMAAGQAQHAVRELGDILEEDGVDVKYAIHPVAGRMPGHMNVLLAEADVSYDKLYAMEDINDDFKNTDVVIVVGANDVVNPAAKTNTSSPIYGMPVLNVEDAKACIVLKRGMAAGFAGIQNELFFYENTMMVFGNAKQTLQSVLEHIKD